MKHTSRFSSERKEIAVKLTVLILIFALGILITVALPTAVNGSVPRVNTVFPVVKSYTPAVSCSGTIEYTDVYEVTADVPVVIASYNVSTGQHADEGQVIAVVDVDATVEAVVALYGAEAAMQSGLTSESIPDKIFADVSGTVCATGKSGELLPAGEAIAQIGEKGSLQLTAAVSQRDISKVNVGQRVSITAADKTYTGTVYEISGFARKEHGGADTVVDVSVTVEDATEDLRSGYSAQGLIETGYAEQILTLPYSAICQDDAGEYVYVFDGGSAKRRDISTGIELAECAQVIGLDIADEVIMHTDELTADCLVIREGIVSRQGDD
ncbi:MAG: HlyD family efflux transporter periplasmic adaptor subunit [Eubacterium sp.]|nr:HlyD family efflux transporter periplasmic adaptor subunit [Eubacterium sp.]